MGSRRAFNFLKTVFRSPTMPVSYTHLPQYAALLPPPHAPPPDSSLSQVVDRLRCTGFAGWWICWAVALLGGGGIMLVVFVFWVIELFFKKILNFLKLALDRVGFL